MFSDNLADEETLIIIWMDSFLVFSCGLTASFGQLGYVAALSLTHHPGCLQQALLGKACGAPLLHSSGKPLLFILSVASPWSQSYFTSSCASVYPWIGVRRAMSPSLNAGLVMVNATPL